MFVITKFVPQLNSYRYKKNQRIDLQETLERYCNVLPVFGFDSAKHDLNLIKCYLLPILVNERDIEPTVIKKANLFISFKFNDIQLLDITNFLGGATSLDSFLKAYGTSETKVFFPYEWFDHPNPLETDHTDYVNLLKNGLTTEQAIVKSKLSKPPLLALRTINTCNKYGSRNKQMSSFKDFLRWYNNKDVVPTLEVAMQKMIAFHHNKDIDKLKLGCFLPNLANIANTNLLRQNSIPSRKEMKTFWKKFGKMLLLAHLSFLHGKQLLMKLLFENQKTHANLLLGLTLANYTPYSMCQPMSTGLYTRWDFDSETSRFIPRQNKTRSLENMVMSYFQRTRPECEIESFLTTGRQKKIDCFSVDGFCSHCNTVFEAMGCFYHFCPCKELRPSLTEEDIQRGSKKRELDAMRRHYIQERVSRFLKCGSANGGDCTKNPMLLNNISEDTFPTDVHLQLSNF